MPATDFHQHLWPERFVAALRSRRRPPLLDGDVLRVAGEPDWPLDLGEHDLDRRLALLDRDGIDVAVISLQTGLGLEELREKERRQLLDAWSEGMRELAADAGGRLRVLAPAADLDGFAGACVPCSALLERDRLAPLLDELQRRNLPLFVHPARSSPPPWAPRWWAAIVDYAAGMQSAYAAWVADGVARWPRLRVVFAMLAGGAPFQLERLQSRGISERDMLHPTVFFETSSYGRRALELVLATHGVTQVVYGSDLPVIDSEATLRAVRGFGDSLASLVIDANPTSLLP